MPETPRKPAPIPSKQFFCPRHPAINEYGFELIENPNSPLGKHGFELLEIEEELEEFELLELGEEPEGFEKLNEIHPYSRRSYVLSVMRFGLQSDVFKFSFCLVDAIIFNDYPNVIFAIGHLSVILARYNGYPIPNFSHKIISCTAYIYHKNVLIRKLYDIALQFYGKKYKDASRTFAGNLDVMVSPLTENVWMQRLHMLRTVYDGVSVMMDRKKFLILTLRALRELLIFRGIYPSV